MGFFDLFSSIFLGLRIFYLRMKVSKKWKSVAEELGIQFKYPGRMYGHVGDVWVAVHIDVQRNDMPPPMIWIESSPNSPLPENVEPEYLKDVIVNVNCERTELLAELKKLIVRAEKVRAQYKLEHPVEEFYS